MINMRRFFATRRKTLSDTMDPGCLAKTISILVDFAGVETVLPIIYILVINTVVFKRPPIG